MFIQMTRQTQFAVTQDDLKRIIERMEREQSPQSLKNIALHIIRGRLEHGHDLSPAALKNLRFSGICRDLVHGLHGLHGFDGIDGIERIFSQKIRVLSA
jgi:hypothetical protein